MRVMVRAVEVVGMAAAGVVNRVVVKRAVVREVVREIEATAAAGVVI